MSAGKLLHQRVAKPLLASLVLLLLTCVAVAQSGSAKVTVVNPPTSPVPVQVTAPGPLTNVGRLASEQVTLEYEASCTQMFLQQVFPDGSVSCFNGIPSGKALVLTDLEWFGTNGTAGYTATFSLSTSSANSSVLRKVANSAALVNQDGNAGASEHMTTGQS